MMTIHILRHQMEDPSAFTTVRVGALCNKTEAASSEVLARLVNANSGKSLLIGIQFWTSRPHLILLIT